MTIGGFSSTTSLTGILVSFDQKDQTFRFIADILSSDELSERYSAVLIYHLQELLNNNLHPSPSARARGAALFFLVHYLAVRAKDTHDYNRILSLIVREDDFVKFLCRFHNIPDELGLLQLGYYTCGTSSLIFTARTKHHDPCILKIIQAQYSAIPAIRAATISYEKYFPPGASQYAPKIFQSSDTWILMELIVGPTLHEYLLDLRKQTESLNSDQYFSISSTILFLLTEALAYYEDLKPQSIVHGDLTPLNVVLTLGKDQITPVGLKLLDFGPNYVLRERVGRGRLFSEAFVQTKLFSAPEVVDRQQEPTLKSDLYSLGIIALDVVSTAPLRIETIGPCLDALWSTPAGVGIARVIEDLIDDDPENRALVLGGPNKYYSRIGRILRAEIALYSDLNPKNASQFEVPEFSARKIASRIFHSLNTIWHIWKSPSSPYKTITKSLPIFSTLNQLSWYLIFAFFIIYTIIDLNEFFDLELLPADTPFFKRFSPHYFISGDLLENFPGRVIGLTFGYVAYSYYANIFASLRVVEFNSWMKPVTNFFLRANSISYFLPIMIAIAINPKLWPFCGAAGTLFPAINNLCCYYCASRSARLSSPKFSIESVHHSSQTGWFLKEFWGWGVLMSFYSAGILVVGWLLYKGYATDAAIYAIAFSILNIAQLYWNNCRRRAPIVLGNLSRLFFSLRRWQIVQNNI